MHIKNQLKKISGNYCTFIIHGSKMGLLPTSIPIAFEEWSIIITRRFLDTTFSSSSSTMVHILEYYRLIGGWTGTSKITGRSYDESTINYNSGIQLFKIIIWIKYLFFPS